MSIFIALCKAFLVGGLICVVGQILVDKTKLTPGKILVLFVVCGVVLGAVGLYEPLANWAGEGATIPLTGFGYNLAKVTRETVDEKGLIGVLDGPLCAASIGVMAAIVSGLIMSIFTKSKDK